MKTDLGGEDPVMPRWVLAYPAHKPARASIPLDELTLESRKRSRCESDQLIRLEQYSTARPASMARPPKSIRLLLGGG